MSGPMAKWSAQLTLLGSILLPAGVLAMEPGLVEFRAEYDGYVGNVPVGTARLAVDRQTDGLYTVVSELVPSDILALLDAERSLERSRIRLADDRIETLESNITKQRRTRTKQIAVVFDWADRIASVSDDRGEVRIPIDKPTYDAASLLLVIIRDASRGSLASHYTALDGRRKKRYGIRDSGNEDLDTEFGTLQTRRVERVRSGSDRSMILWLAPELGHLPVRIVTTRHGEAQLRLELRNVEGIDAERP